MAYKVINDFFDKEDKNTFYRKGDVYPKGSHKPTKKRIEQLSKPHKVHKYAFIEEVKEETKASKKE